MKALYTNQKKVKYPLSSIFLGAKYNSSPSVKVHHCIFTAACIIISEETKIQKDSLF